MKVIKHNIGAQLKLPVERVVTIKGRKSYIVRYEDSLCRVQMFDWQENESTPKHIYLTIPILDSDDSFLFDVPDCVFDEEYVGRA